MVLNKVPVGDTVVVAGDGVLHPPESMAARRLLHQGIVTGSVLTVLSTTAGGGRVIGVGRSRVALAPAVARGISVEYRANHG